MKVSICIPTFNQASFLAVAVQSAIDQSEVETEVWVADDASSDNTSEIMAKYSSDSRVKYIRREQNLGIAKNAGTLLTLPETEYIVRLDSDDFLELSYVSTLSKQLDKFPDAAIAHCSVNQVDQSGRVTRRRELNRANGFQSADEALMTSVKGYKVAANICMFRKSALPKDFIYRDGLNFGEDWDLWIRVADSGWGNVYVDSPLANYRVWTDSAGYRSSRKVAELRGIETVFDVTLKEAFLKRGWDVTPLRKARRRFANQHVISLTEISSDADGAADVKKALMSLSENDLVCRIKMAIVDVGSGFILRIHHKARSVTVGLAKSAFRWLRSF